ncbi:helix-turn-helix transcriptional regulator [Nocardioides humi]|uniref:HTH luxR-type domain-containing protein n=1 Tax=Nocardioides humi TaxID=449461 RepID=A0ABN2AC62_9ACTN|nr:LuxR C-terminal-related transcriptional regulator [Nocardioides humi]
MAHSPGATSASSRPLATLHRSRLLDLVASGATPVTVLQAPSGFGKTTLLRQWIAARRAAGEEPCWVALAAGVPELPDEPLLVLDGYERLGAATQEVDAMILERVATRPGVRVVVTTRAATGLADPVRRANGTTTVIGERDLVFTAEETERFLAQDGSTTRAEAGVVHADTRGFPLAVRAASLALRPRRGLPGRSTTGWWIIVACDLSAQLAGPDTWEFVRDTCAAPHLDPELARALSEAPDPAVLMAGLEADGFGRWDVDDAGRPVFRMIDALRDAARAELVATDPERYRWSAGVAATWLHDRGDHVPALELAVAAGRYELAGRIVCSVLAVVPESRVAAQVDLHLSRIPRSVVVQNPRLALARALVLASNPTTRHGAREYFLRVVDQPALDERSAGRPALFVQQVARSVALRHVARYADAGAAARAALAAHDELEPGDDQRLVDVRAGALRHLAYSLFQAGEVERAHAVAARAVAAAQRPWSRTDTAAYAFGLAAIDGRTRTASATAAAAVGETPAHGLAVVGNALLRLDRFDFAGALAEHDEGAFLGTGELWPFVAWTRLQAHLGLGDVGAELERISTALRSRPAPPGVGQNLGTTALHGLVATVLLAQGRGRNAAPLLQAATRWPGQLAPALLLDRLAAGDAQGALDLLPRLQVQPGHTVRSRAGTATLGAAAALRAGCTEAAGALLDQAAALHAEHGVRAHLLHVPAEDLAALRDLALRRGDAAAYLGDDAIGAAGRAVGLDAGVDAVPLTSQEIAVLRASLDHPRRSEVAAALHLSPETVKSHMRSIYRKWGVNSREAAIERGIQLAVLGGPRV